MRMACSAEITAVPTRAASSPTEWPGDAVGGASGALHDRFGRDQRCRDDERLGDAGVADRVGIGLGAVHDEIHLSGLGVGGEALGDAVEFEPGRKETGGL